jgi:type I restriction enzyme R subunit
MEVKHEKNQNVHEAGAQYGRRDHGLRIFQRPFLHIAADTSEVKVATDPRREENFRWFNSGLTNKPLTEGEYPIRHYHKPIYTALSVIIKLR